MSQIFATEPSGCVASASASSSAPAPQEVIEEAVELMTYGIDEKALEFKFKSTELPKPDPVEDADKLPDFTKMSREQLFAELDRWRDDPNFDNLPLPFDYIKARPKYWDEKGSGISFNDYIKAHEMITTLAETPKHEDRLEKVKNRLRKKLADKAKRVPTFTTELVKKNNEAKQRINEEKSKSITNGNQSAGNATASGAGRDD